jgi:DNA polymerase-1
LQLAAGAGDGGTFTYVVDCNACDPSPLWGVLRGKTVVGHNLVFDLTFLARLGFEPGAVHDTLLLSQLSHGSRQKRGFHTLGEVVARELGRTLDKTAQISDWSGDLTDAQVAYAAADAAVLPDLYRSLAAKVVASGQGRVAEIEARCLPAVAWMSGCGAPFNRAAWEVLAAEAALEAEALARALDEVAPPRQGFLQKAGAWNWDSPVQVKEAFDALGVVLESTDDDALAAVDHPLAGLIRRYRSAGKLASTYGTDWTKDAYGDGQLYPGWRQLGADSGRMACREPNAQNLPQDVRYRACFAAPPGRVLVKADYSQIELRIAAKLTKDKALLEAYARGDDLHTRTARSVLGVQDVSKEDRKLAKALNFGLLYGMGVKGFRSYARSNYGLDLSEAQAGEYRRAFFSAYPGLARWHRQVGCSGDRAVETRTLAGRRRAGVIRFTEKLNSPVQGSGADGLKLALALLWERRAECPGAFPMLAVHDEIVVECDAGQADAAAAWVKAAMVEAMAPLLDPVPAVMDVHVGATWAGD